jgi:hypothetical protein
MRCGCAGYGDGVWWLINACYRQKSERLIVYAIVASMHMLWVSRVMIVYECTLVEPIIFSTNSSITKGQAGVAAAVLCYAWC